MTTNKLPVAHERLLNNIYYNVRHPAGFSTVDKLYKSVGKKISKKNIQKFLLQQETYTRHKPKRNNFSRNHYEINNIDDLWESDLIDFTSESIRKINDNFSFIVGENIS